MSNSLACFVAGGCAEAALLHDSVAQLDGVTADFLTLRRELEEKVSEFYCCGLEHLQQVCIKWHITWGRGGVSFRAIYRFMLPYSNSGTGSKHGLVLFISFHIKILHFFSESF